MFVMVSSTGELAEHRQLARQAIDNISALKALTQESTPGTPRKSLETSLDWVRRSSLVIFLIGRTYGSLVPNGDISYCEAEWNEAQLRKKPCLAFFIDETAHPIPPELLKAYEKCPDTFDRQRRFRARVQAQVTRTNRGFASAVEAQAMVAVAVAETLPQLESADRSRRSYAPSRLPTPPAAYTPHVYTLSAGSFIGRGRELAALSTWAAAGSNPVYALVGLGGMGKSALAWRWFMEDAPSLKPGFDGYFWWSFYEENAGYSEFLAHAVAYVTGRSVEWAAERSGDQNMQELVSELSRRRFLFCLDGLERIMHGYRHYDMFQASGDAEAGLGKGRAADRDLDAIFVGHNARDVVGRRYRTAVDRGGVFLRQICGLPAARILITSRLRPADFETRDRQLVSGVTLVDRMRLSDADAIALMRGLGVEGAARTMARIARSVENHPLTLRVLAGEIRNNRRAAHDIDRWIELQPNFNPSGLELIQRKSHILFAAFLGMKAPVLATLAAIAAFRGPAHFDDLSRILLDRGGLFENEASFSAAIDELEARLLIGTDALGSTFDMHPIIRGLVWRGIGQESREEIARLHGQHFDSVASTSAERNFFALQQSFFSLIELKRYDEAQELARPSVEVSIVSHARARETIEMLECLFDPVAGQALVSQQDAAQALHNDLSVGYSYVLRHVEALSAAVRALESFKLRPDHRVGSELILVRNAVNSLLALCRRSDARRIWDIWRSGKKKGPELQSPHVLELEAQLRFAEGAYRDCHHLTRDFIASVEEDWPVTWHATAASAALLAAEAVRLAQDDDLIPPANLVNYAIRHAGRHKLLQQHLLAQLARLRIEHSRPDRTDQALAGIAPVQRIIDQAGQRGLIAVEMRGLIVLINVALAIGAFDVAERAAETLEEYDGLYDDIEQQARSLLAIAQVREAGPNPDQAWLFASRALLLVSDESGGSGFADVSAAAKLIVKKTPLPLLMVKEHVDDSRKSAIDESVRGLLAAIA